MKKDVPLPFFDMSWLAVKNPKPEVVMDVLSLSDAQVVTWKQGLSAVCGDYWDFAAHLDAPLSRVFITPRIQGWRLVVGGSYGANEDGGSDGFRNAARMCRKLSAIYGKTHAFTTQGRMAVYAWILASEGRTYREFVCDADILTNRGKPAKAEIASMKAWDGDDEWYPSEVDVMAVAAETSINPLKLGRKTKCVGKGFLAVTKWGRKNGVPERSLDD